VHVAGEICLTPHGESCAAGGGLSFRLFVALAMVAVLLVYGAVFIRRDNVRPLLRRFGPLLAVVAGALVVWVALSWT
jgi:multisubunit Na+/H+ antiporter MnhB subunit